MLSCCVDIVECCTLCYGCHEFTSDTDSFREIAENCEGNNFSF